MLSMNVLRSDCSIEEYVFEYNADSLESKRLQELQLILERATGFEPATKSLGSSYSTTELRPLRRWKGEYSKRAMPFFRSRRCSGQQRTRPRPPHRGGLRQLCCRFRGQQRAGRARVVSAGWARHAILGTKAAAKPSQSCARERI
jgi:hypothetical protein